LGEGEKRKRESIELLLHHNKGGNGDPGGAPGQRYIHTSLSAHNDERGRQLFHHSHTREKIQPQNNAIEGGG
jgi:hypothetical protein